MAARRLHPALPCPPSAQAGQERLHKTLALQEDVVLRAPEK